MANQNGLNKVSVIVPRSPFTPPGLVGVKHCLAALDVDKLIEWWPGKPHSPHRDADKVRDIQRSLDWKRVAQIASYLLQDEIRDTADELDQCFKSIYEPRSLEPGREWPPRVRSVTGYEPSEYPVFSNILVHVNGATVTPKGNPSDGTAELAFSEKSKNLRFSVIDGQHRINGAYFALHLLRKSGRPAEPLKWEIPAEIFVDLDPPDAPPRRQAQVFIDVNFYQKKVDRSLVADLFPTTRSDRQSLNDKERAEDIGRKLMLEDGPLVGMIQIPGVKYGVKDVVTLATLNSAVENVLDTLRSVGLTSLSGQTSFLACALDAWFEASGRREEVQGNDKLNPENVAYQGRVLVSFIALVPACLAFMKSQNLNVHTEEFVEPLSIWLRQLMQNAGLIEAGRFIGKSQFKTKGFVGSGGIGRFRDRLWAAVDGTSVWRLRSEEAIAARAERNRAATYLALGES